MSKTQPTTELMPGMAVTRVASEQDYTNGRKGKIIEINQEAERARVHWTQEKTGHKISIRTWVKFSFLRVDNG